MLVLADFRFFAADTDIADAAAVFIADIDYFELIFCCHAMPLAVSAAAIFATTPATIRHYAILFFIFARCHFVTPCHCRFRFCFAAFPAVSLFFAAFRFRLITFAFRRCRFLSH